MTEKDKDFLEGLAISVACHVLPVRKVFREPIAYSYNGTILPKLPEFDKTVYPYVAIAYVAPYETYAIVISTAPMYINTNNYVACSADLTQLEYRLNSGEWELTGTFNKDAEALLLPTSYLQIIWSNYDVLCADGSVYSAASDPIPLYKFLGYSYNGVILPALPEWDREMYPYAFIGHNFIMTPILYVASEITHGYDDYDYWVAYGVRIATYDGTANAWTESDGAESYQNVSRIDWANFDVLNEDGSVYLSASEPIPVYE